MGVFVGRNGALCRTVIEVYNYLNHHKCSRLVLPSGV